MANMYASFFSPGVNNSNGFHPLMSHAFTNSGGYHG